MKAVQQLVTKSSWKRDHPVNYILAKPAAVAILCSVATSCRNPSGPLVVLLPTGVCEACCACCSGFYGRACTHHAQSAFINMDSERTFGLFLHVADIPQKRTSSRVPVRLQCCMKRHDLGGCHRGGGDSPYQGQREGLWLPGPQCVLAIRHSFILLRRKPHISSQRGQGFPVCWENWQLSEIPLNLGKEKDRCICPGTSPMKRGHLKSSSVMYVTSEVLWETDSRYKAILSACPAPSATLSGLSSLSRGAALTFVDGDHLAAILGGTPRDTCPQGALRNLEGFVPIRSGRRLSTFPSEIPLLLGKYLIG